jgi:Tfp pilus assembly protein PilX
LLDELRAGRVSGDAVIARLRREEGIALLLALAFTVALSLLVFGMVSYVTSNQHNAKNSSTDNAARAYAEAALDVAYSTIKHAGNTVGLNPANPALLGCAADTGVNANGNSDCSSPSPLCVPVVVACPSGTYTATVGTGTVTGYYTGQTTTSSYAGISKDASWWILAATGYARNASGKMDVKTLRATVQVTALDQGAVASVWNHVFLTAPWVQGVCQTTYSGNTTVLDMPVYTIGNLCFTGNSSGLSQTAGGQNIDLQVGGTLYYGGNGDFVGSSSTPIYSGVVKMGCSTSAAALSSATLASPSPPCVNGSSPSYHATNAGSYVSQDDPEMTDTQAEKDYANFDPGPRHPCLSGTTPSPLTLSQLDFAIGGTEGISTMPNNSGSGSAGGVFDVTPGTSYACVSQSGLNTGYLIWNAGNSSMNVTVGGVTVTVASKQLAINGSVFIDAPIQFSQSMTYKGVGVIMVSGQVNFPTNQERICAQNTNCAYSNWQGSSGNNDMLTVATLLASSATAINWTAQGITWQGSIWCRPSSTFFLTGQGGPVIQGPMSVGAMNISGNSFTFNPLPVIKNMPVGAPVPPNVSAQIGNMNVYG